MILTKDIIQEYDNLINAIESKNNRLLKEHSAHINCKKTCSSCCLDFKIVPVEKFIIHNKFSENNINTASFIKSGNTCKYLSNGECSIYQYRPIMCRTHGFPLLYLNEDETAYEFSTCDLNFLDYDLDEVSEANSIMMDDHNYIINKLNIEFFEINPELNNIAGTLVEW